MPVPFAVALTQVLAQPREVARSGPARDVRGDGVRGILQALESAHALEHEVPDAHGTVHLHHRCDVHEHERGRHRIVRLADCDERREATKGRADERRALWQRGGDGEHVTREGAHAVVAVGCPLAVAVAAQVDRQRVSTAGREGVAGGAPRVAGLAAAVQQHDRRVRRVAVRGRRELEVVARDAKIGHPRIMTGSRRARSGGSSPSR